MRRKDYQIRRPASGFRSQSLENTAAPRHAVFGADRGGGDFPVGLN
jgi:hypothetical protein